MSYMADFEDSNSPTWQNNVDGQINVRDAVNRTIEYTSPEGKAYRLNAKTRHACWSGPGAGISMRSMCCWAGGRFPDRFSISVYFSSTTPQRCWNRVPGPISICRRLESHLEARLWNDVFNFSQDALRYSARLDPRDGADRNDSGLVRDGRDPL